MVNAMILARENRIMIMALQKSVGEIKINVQDMVNHYSKRLPIWATILFTILGALVTGLIVAVVK